MARYSCEIDWISLVLPVNPSGDGAGQGTVSELVERAVYSEIPTYHIAGCFSDLQPLAFGRSPYAFGWADTSRGITIWAGGEMPHITVEFSGRGMAYLREIGMQKGIVEAGVERASRFDLAVDLEQGVEPEEFLKYRKGGRQTSHARFDSSSGKTVYIGSRHSERYMRVYRYASPHPRSHLLRLETVFKRAYAKQACAQALEVGLDAVAKTSLEEFGFGGLVDFDESVPEADLSIFRAERNMGKTLRWMITQVAPAFKRLVKEGTIPNAEQFLQSYFLGDLPD